MMDMAADNAVVPEETLPHGPGSGRFNLQPQMQPSRENNSTWAQITPLPHGVDSVQYSHGAPAAPGQLHRMQSKPPSGVRLAMRRVSALFNPNNEDMDTGRRKSHYRRGSILIKHLENKKAAGKATDKDMKFFEMVKSQFDNNIMESRTIISLSVFQTGSNPLEDPFAVIHMPVEIQQGFRRKLFAIFSVQLFAVVALICLFSYTPFLDAALRPRFAKWPFVFAAFVAMVLALLWLYVVKYKFPLNFVVLALYTVTQSLFFTGFDCLFDTRASIFIFGFLFCIMAITTALCTIVAKRAPVSSAGRSAGAAASGKGDSTAVPLPSSLASSPPVAVPVLISYPLALLVAFFTVFLGSLLVYFYYMQDVVSAVQYSASLGAMLLLVLWFAYDASCMNERLSPDEYMQGMVFFYTDMVLFLLFLSIIFVACFACEGDCACYGTADIAPIGTGAGGENDGGENDDDVDEEGGENDAGDDDTGP